MSQAKERVLEMCTKALQIEVDGKAFYQRAAEMCHNKLGQEVFSMLMADEEVHAKRIQMIYDAMKLKESWTDDWKCLVTANSDLGNFIKIRATRGEPDPQAGDVEALDVGLASEDASINFYKRQLAAATDPLERAFLNKMVEEESVHYQVLNDMKFYLTNPAEWFLEKEHSGLDGA
ncbi:MAG: ferritin family protein [Deltaproteobacteria bacterium]|nr:ferritin family protein [Deltaproteobacteria bacterium]